VSSKTHQFELVMIHHIISIVALALNITILYTYIPSYI
jgi:hypothetical protein